jgi:TatD DNase family protein
MLIDTHCHLDPQYYPGGPEAALDRARAAGVDAFVAIGVGPDLGAARHVIGLAERYRDVFAVAGVHPHDAAVLGDVMLAELDALVRHPKVVAIGEIGLDYHYMYSPKEAQQATFRKLIGLALEHKKPIVIHTREAPLDTLSILQEEGARDVGGIVHCFSEDRAFAEKALALDFDLSFSGIVTFKNATSVHDVATWAPADRVLVETDSPYLAPVPVRGKPCEPAYVLHTARRIAALRGEDFAAFAARSSDNARRRLRLSV